MKLTSFLTILVILSLVFIGSFFIYSQDVFSPTNNQNEEKNEENAAPEGDIKIEKQVKVDLSQQKVFLFEKGKIVAEYLISSGKPETPTPAGKFRVISKQDMVYSKIAGCWLSFWVGFTDDGDYGFHETPICDGKRQGEDKIGSPVSLGCLRLKLGEAEKFYKWVEIETPIEIIK